MSAAKATSKSAMSDDHKSALAKGRNESLAVRRYLDALTASKPKRGRRRTAASIDARLVAIEVELAAADALTRLSLLQERKDLEAEKDSLDQKVDLSAAESGFVAVAKSYGERKGIDYSTWREIGVEAKVLKAAGVPRTRRA